MSSGMSRPSKIPATLVGAGASGWYSPRGAGSGRVPFPAQSPARPESRFRSEMDAAVGVSIQGQWFRCEWQSRTCFSFWQGCRAQSHEGRAVDFIEQCVSFYPAVLVEQLLLCQAIRGCFCVGYCSKRFHALFPCCLPKGIRILPFFQFVLITPIFVPLFPVAHAIPPNTSVARFRSAGPGAPNSPDNIQRCQGSLSLRKSRGSSVGDCGAYRTRQRCRQR